MRYFELNLDDHIKFWNIELEGEIIKKHYGKKGQKGREVADKYIDEQSAQKDALRLIAKRIKEGYVEIVGEDTTHEKWHDEKAKPKAKPKAAPAKVKEKRIPVELSYIQTDLKPQTDFEALPVFNSLRIKSQTQLPDNHYRFRYLDNGKLCAVSDYWSEITDLIDLKTGLSCRMSHYESERRVSGLFLDNNYFYALAIKGFEAEFRSLVKYDLDTQEIVWSCGVSGFSTGPIVEHDDQNIYLFDNKMLHVVSKTTGKSVSKIPVVTKMSNVQKINAGREKRFINILYADNKTQVLTASSLAIVMVDVATSEKVWEIKSNEYQRILAHYIVDKKLYLLGKNKIILEINLSDGSILSRHPLPIDDFSLKAVNSPFDLKDQCLRAAIADEKYVFLLKIDTQKSTFQLEELTQYIPAEIIRGLRKWVITNNLIIGTTHRGNLFVFDLDNRKIRSTLQLPTTELVDAFIVLGDHIYIEQYFKVEDNRRPSDLRQYSTLYQISE